MAELVVVARITVTRISWFYHHNMKEWTARKIKEKSDRFNEKNSKNTTTRNLFQPKYSKRTQGFSDKNADRGT